MKIRILPFTKKKNNNYCRETLGQVSPEDAIKVALELKKDLVDQGQLSLTQADLEKHLFHIMETRGYGQIYRERFTMTLKYILSLLTAPD